MKLFICVKDGVPINHPIVEDNFLQAFPTVDVNNLPQEFSEFVRIKKPIINVYEVYEGMTYEKVGNVFQDVHSIRTMTPTEKTATQNVIKDNWLPSAFTKSWIFYEDTCTFAPPIPMPDDNNQYNWDENTTSWVVLK